MRVGWKVAGFLAASVVALASAFLIGGGRYQMLVGMDRVPMRLDRWTGEMMVCTTRLCVIYPTQRPERFPPPPPASPSNPPKL